MRLLALLLLTACAPAKPAAAPQAPANRVEPAADHEPLGWNEGVRPFLTDLLAELRATGERERHPKLIDLVTKTTALILLAENGELTKAALLARYDQLVVEMTDPIEEWVAIQLDDLRSLLRKAQVAPFDED
jgi:hypothetical protein